MTATGENRRKGRAAVRPESASGDNERGRVVAEKQAHWVRQAAVAVGAVFLLVGVAGFVPGITSYYGELSFGGHESGAELLGIFQVSILHNIVHLLFGIAGLALARTAAQARTYLVYGGAIYLVLFVYGLIVGQESAANFVPVNTADDFLHLILGIGMIGLGLALTRDRSAVAGATR